MMKHLTIIAILILILCTCSNKKPKQVVEKPQTNTIEIDKTTEGLKFPDIPSTEFQNFLFDENGITVDVDLPAFSFLNKKSLDILKQGILMQIMIMEFNDKSNSKIEVVDIYKRHRKEFDGFYYKNYKKELKEFIKEGYVEKEFVDYDYWLGRNNFYYELYGKILSYNNNILVYYIIKEYPGYHDFFHKNIFMYDLKTLQIIDEKTLFENQYFDTITSMMKAQFDLNSWDWKKWWDIDSIKPDGNCYFTLDASLNKWHLVWQTRCYQEYGSEEAPQIKLEISKLQPFFKIDISSYISKDGLFVNQNQSH